jgi:hypothetical protein
MIDSDFYGEILEKFRLIVVRFVDWRLGIGCSEA